jgi:hypothetical protein
MKEIRKKIPTPSSTTILSFQNKHACTRAHTHKHTNKSRYTQKSFHPFAFVRNEEPLPMAMPTLLPPFRKWALHVSLRCLYLRDCNPTRPVPPHPVRRPIFSLRSSPTSHIIIIIIITTKDLVFKLSLDFSSF